MIYIIVRAKNGHEMTKECIASLTHTASDYRIVLVDDGSNPPLECDGVPDVIIRNRSCRGAVTASNQGMSIALADPACEYILILDNDTLIPDGDTDWLARMVAELEEGGPRCAAVGATTNFANPPQHILTVPQTYLRDWKQEVAAGPARGGQKTNPPVPAFVSFAVLLRASVVRKMGLWDTRYDPGNYEDTDYSVYLRANGYEINVARSVYIHHAGHQTFSDQLKELLAQNFQKFVAKWGAGRLYDMGMVSKEQIAQVLQ